jgi:hypothetical protein
VPQNPDSDSAIYLHRGSPYLTYRYALQATVYGARRKVGLSLFREVF